MKRINFCLHIYVFIENCFSALLIKICLQMIEQTTRLSIPISSAAAWKKHYRKVPKSYFYMRLKAVLGKQFLFYFPIYLVYGFPEWVFLSEIHLPSRKRSLIYHKKLERQKEYENFIVAFEWDFFTFLANGIHCFQPFWLIYFIFVSHHFRVRNPDMLSTIVYILNFTLFE